MRSILVLLVCALVLFASTAQAADITWGNATTIVDDNDVINTGSTVAAYNIGSTPSAVTIHGVPFDAFPIANGSGSATTGSLTVKGFESPPGTFLPINSASPLGSASAPFSSLSANYQSLLGTGAAESSSPPILDLTFSGLTVGKAYTVQIWSNDSFPFFGGGPVGVSDFNGHFKTLDSNTTNAGGGLGQFIVGTFTADASTEFISVSGAAQGSSAVLNAIQLRGPVPEPTSLGTLAMASALILRRGRLRSYRTQ